jgi:hypothetical protein
MSVGNDSRRWIDASVLNESYKNST